MRRSNTQRAADVSRLTPVARRCVSHRDEGSVHSVPERVHHIPNLIYSVGTQVVSLREIVIERQKVEG